MSLRRPNSRPLAPSQLLNPVNSGVVAPDPYDSPYDSGVVAPGLVPRRSGLVVPEAVSCTLPRGRYSDARRSQPTGSQITTPGAHNSQPMALTTVFAALSTALTTQLTSAGRPNSAPPAPSALTTQLPTAGLNSQPSNGLSCGFIAREIELQQTPQDL